MDHLVDKIISHLENDRIYVVDKPNNSDFLYFTDQKQAVEFVLEIIIDHYTNSRSITNIEIFDDYIDDILKALNNRGPSVRFFLNQTGLISKNYYKFCFHKRGMFHAIPNEECTKAHQDDETCQCRKAPDVYECTCNYNESRPLYIRIGSNEIVYVNNQYENKTYKIVPASRYQ